MLHLAQVERIESPDKVGLRLLARQRSEYAWTMLLEQEILPLENTKHGVGAFVIVELSEAHQILAVNDAKDWLLDVMQTFLRNGVTPAFLQEEYQRAEQWRQTLTLQSQDLDRRALELEARREQIEQLEETLKREKKQMELLATQYKEQTQEFDRRDLELKTHREQVQQLEESVRREKQQIEDLAQSRLEVSPPVESSGSN